MSVRARRPQRRYAKGVDESERDKYERARRDTRQARLDFIETELQTGATFITIVETQRRFAEDEHVRDSRRDARRAIEVAADHMARAKEQGQDVEAMEQRLQELKSRLERCSPPRSG
jgi:hypothetical protein